MANDSIFFQVNLPNPTTWFYFSALLAVALFFKFSRLLSIRNLDVVTLFLLMPGFLLLHEKGSPRFWGYLWLLGASVYYLLRCLFDLTLIRRPALTPNINFGGLVWLAGALFVSHLAVPVQKSGEPSDHGETARAPIDPMLRQGEKMILQQTPPDVDESSVLVWVERGVTLLCHLSVVVGLMLIGKQHFEHLLAGMAAATLYLLLPYTYLLMPETPLGLGRWDHAWPMALMIWAVFFYRRPTLAGLLLGSAAGTAFFPALLLPLWLSFYWRRGGGRFGFAFVLSAGVCLAVLGGILWVNGELPHALSSGWKPSAWLPWLPPDADTRGLWQGIPSHWAYRVPIFLAYIVLVGASAFWPSPKNLAHVLALSAAIILGVQFWFADQGGVYVLWYLPFLLLLVFRPNLSACQPQPPGDDWLRRTGQWLRRLGWRVIRFFHPARPSHHVARIVP
jgi:hypothetical protein